MDADPTDRATGEVTGRIATLTPKRYLPGGAPICRMTIVCGDQTFELIALNDVADAAACLFKGDRILARGTWAIERWSSGDAAKHDQLQLHLTSIEKRPT